MKNTLEIFALLCVFAATACTKDNNTVPYDGTIKFSVDVTKATDTSFENGDQISLFAGNPINSGNVKLTYSNATVTPSKTLYWGDGQTSATVFEAVYPYDASYSSSEVSFTVKTDQSSSVNYKASDLMTALTSQTPGNTVSLNFSHRLSKLSINITNKSGYAITGISAASVKNSFDCATGKSSGSATVQACKVSDSNWVVILAPQETDGTITVQTTGGNYTFSGKFVLYAGKKSDCNVEVSGGSTPPDPTVAAFSCTVNNWETGSTFTFTQEGTTPTPPAGGDILNHNFKTDGQGSFTINNVVIPDDISYVWTLTSDYGMKASAYVNQIYYATESWLISPEIDLRPETSAHLEFKHAGKFFADITNDVQLMVTVDGNSWSRLAIPTYPDGTSWTFVSSGDIDLSAYAGKKIKLGFKYTSSSSASGTWEIEYVKITR